MRAETSPEEGGAAADLATAHRELLADDSFQFKFDTPEAPPEPSSLPGWVFDFLNALAPLLEFIFWAGVTLVAATIVYAIGRELLARYQKGLPKAPAVAAPEPPKFRPTPARARALLEEADRLAREGRYSEAVRIILHHSIEDMEQVLSLNIPLSLTSREIAMIDRLSTQGRAVFTKIARAVELSLFGSQPLTADQYIECRKDYEAFVFGGSPA